MNELWSNLKLPADLRKHMTLSAADVADLTVLAKQAADPKAKLEELLIEKAKGRQETAARHKAERMQLDIKRINDTDRWPLPWLPVKTQPWITDSDGRMQHGIIERECLLTVLIEGEAARTYNSIEDLVAYWSVD